MCISIYVYAHTHAAVINQKSLPTFWCHKAQGPSTTLLPQCVCICLHCRRTINAISCFNRKKRTARRIKVTRRVRLPSCLAAWLPACLPAGSYGNNSCCQMKNQNGDDQVKSLRIRSVVLKFTACLVIFMHARCRVSSFLLPATFGSVLFSHILWPLNQSTNKRK